MLYRPASTLGRLVESPTVSRDTEAWRPRTQRALANGTCIVLSSSAFLRLDAIPFA